ncbi:MAG: trans-sulfuration enzyme family protein [Terriglobia bacterium]
MSRNLHLETILVHGGRRASGSSAVSPPIFQTSTYRLANTRAGADFQQSVEPSEYYTRWGNPTTHVLEVQFAQLEGAEAALAFSSGMGAISTALLADLKQGDHIVAGAPLYAGTTELCQGVLPRFGIETTFVDPADTAAFARALRPNTRCIYVETPSNPTLTLTDLAGVAALAQQRGLLSICDNTFATPLGQRPLALGMAVVVHSATKYVGGHSDVVAGLLAGSKSYVEKCWQHAKLFGPALDPFAAWLLLRGLKTLGVRHARQADNALQLARFLAGHQAVSVVHYPGLASHPQHALARRQMQSFGAMLSFELTGGSAAAQRFAESLQVALLAVSLGGVETLVQHPASMSHGLLAKEDLNRTGISEGLVRVSVGVEPADDLIADFEQALRVAAAA